MLYYNSSRKWFDFQTNDLRKRSCYPLETTLSAFFYQVKSKQRSGIIEVRILSKVSLSFIYHVALRSEAMRTKIFGVNVRSNRVKINDCLSPLRECTDCAPKIITSGLRPLAFVASKIILSANEPKFVRIQNLSKV